MSKVLIIDDSDPAIQYSGGWTAVTNVGATTNEYKSTIHRSENAGDTLSYTFYGTEIKVYGTIDTPNVKGSPNMAFSVDGSAPINFNNTGAVYVDDGTIASSHIRLYQTTGLTRGSHTLSITTGTPVNPAARLYIDFFAVNTGSDSAVGTIIADERDFLFTYTGTWSGFGAADEYLGTTSLCPGNGSSATFRFNGTSATLYGTTRDTTGPTTTAVIGFSLDGTQQENFTGPQNAKPIKNTPFFHAEGLSADREHTIVATSLSSNEWYMDYAVYTAQESSTSNGGGGSQTSSPQGTNSGGGGQTTSPQGANQGSGGSQTTSPQGTNGGGSGQATSTQGTTEARVGGLDSENKTSSGVIAGAAVAGVVGILAIAAIIFMLLRKRRAQHSGHNEKFGATKGDSIIPFNSPSPDMQPYRVPNDYNPAAGTVPPSNDMRASRSALLRAPSSSVYSEPESSVQGGTSMVGAYSIPLSPTLPSDPMNSHTGYSPNTPLYSPGNTGSRESSGSRYTLHDPQVQMMTQPTGLKSQFMGIPPATIPPARRHPPSLALTVEEDSGIRLPLTSPPIYTRD